MPLRILIATSPPKSNNGSPKQLQCGSDASVQSQCLRASTTSNSGSGASTQASIRIYTSPTSHISNNASVPSRSLLAPRSSNFSDESSNQPRSSCNTSNCHPQHRATAAMSQKSHDASAQYQRSLDRKQSQISNEINASNLSLGTAVHQPSHDEPSQSQCPDAGDFPQCGQDTAVPAGNVNESMNSQCTDDTTMKRQCCYANSREASMQQKSCCEREREASMQGQCCNEAEQSCYETAGRERSYGGCARQQECGAGRLYSKRRCCPTDEACMAQCCNGYQQKLQCSSSTPLSQCRPNSSMQPGCLPRGPPMQCSQCPWIGPKCLNRSSTSTLRQSGTQVNPCVGEVESNLSVEYGAESMPPKSVCTSTTSLRDHGTSTCPRRVMSGKASQCGSQDLLHLNKHNTGTTTCDLGQNVYVQTSDVVSATTQHSYDELLPCQPASVRDVAVSCQSFNAGDAIPLSPRCGSHSTCPRSGCADNESQESAIHLRRLHVKGVSEFGPEGCASPSQDGSVHSERIRETTTSQPYLDGSVHSETIRETTTFQPCLDGSVHSERIRETTMSQPYLDEDSTSLDCNCDEAMQPRICRPRMQDCYRRCIDASPKPGRSYDIMTGIVMIITVFTVMAILMPNSCHFV